MLSRARLGVFSDDEVRDVVKMRERLIAMDAVSLRALIRQSTHQIDNGSQRFVLSPEETRVRMERARSVLKTALGVYKARGYNINKSDIKYAYSALRRGDEFAKTPIYRDSLPDAPFGESDLTVVERLITGRRSVRRFSNEDVAADLIDRVLEAATWAPCACSLQGCRFIVIKNAETKKLFAQPWAAPVIIVGGFDERPYELIKGNELPYNPYLDLGAAMQNMLLMAYALGLGTCIGTFSGELNSIRRKLEVPDDIKIITYFVLGWPDDKPTTVPRMELEEFILLRE